MADAIIPDLNFLDSASRTTAEKYNCPQCKRLLRNAVQPSCGHRLCEECVKGLFRSSTPTCPRPDCQEKLTPNEYIPDRHVRKEISNLKVRCCGHGNRGQLDRETQGLSVIAELEDRDFRLSLIENSSFDGTMVWKIPQFEQRMADTKSVKYTSISSLPFYTGRYGYKMCLHLYILGDGIGKNTHMSLFFVVMRNEFDNILQWPFTHRVTFRLINQYGGRDIVETFQPDPASSSFRKPKSDMNIASGCPKFVSLQELKNGFILEDTIYIRCVVDSSTI